MNDIIEIIARSSGSLPSLGQVLFVSETGSTTQNRDDGVGRIDKPFELQRALDVAYDNDTIIVYYNVYGFAITPLNIPNKTISIFFFGEVGSSSLLARINAPDASNVNIHFLRQAQVYFLSPTRVQSIRFYESARGTIDNISDSTIYFLSNASSSIFSVINANNTSIICSSQNISIIAVNLLNCRLASINRRNALRIQNISNTSIENFQVGPNASLAITFISTTFKNVQISINLFTSGSSVNNCRFYNSRVHFLYNNSSHLFQNNNFFASFVEIRRISSGTPLLNADGTTNNFVDCTFKNISTPLVPIDMVNGTLVFVRCVISANNPITSGCFNLGSSGNIYLLDTKYEVPVSTSYAIANSYTGELQLINCYLPTNITGGKTPTVTSNVFIGTLPNISDVLSNI